MIQKTLKLIEKGVRRKVEKERKSWPPTCIGFFHQPVRPKNTIKK